MTYLAETVVKVPFAGQRKLRTPQPQRRLCTGTLGRTASSTARRGGAAVFALLEPGVKALKQTPRVSAGHRESLRSRAGGFPDASAGRREGGRRGASRPTGPRSLFFPGRPTARPWYEVDDSLRSVNARLRRDRDGGMVGLIGRTPVSGTPLARTSEGTPAYVAELLGTLWRSGDSPRSPTSCTRPCSRRPTITARPRSAPTSWPVPMTVLAETVVKEIPLKRGERGTPDLDRKR